MFKKRLLAFSLSLAMLVLAGAGCAQTSTSATSAATTAAEASTTAAPSTAGTSSDPFADAPVIKIQFAENQPANSPIGTLAEDFIKKVAEQTNNTVQIEFFPDALLGDETTVVGMIEAGTVEFTRVNLASLQATVPDVGVLTLPYLYNDADHCNRVLESEVGQEILGKLQDANIVGLTYLKASGDAEFRSFYSKEPIRSLADLKGKKVRVQESEIVINMIKALGAVPTPMAFGEVFQALQTGVVDVAENPMMGYYLTGHYEAAKYFTYDKHQISPNVYIMSEKCYSAMTDAQKEVFMKALDEYIDAMIVASNAASEEYKQKCIEAGVEFIEVDTTEFQQAVQPMYSNYPQYKDYLDKILAIK